MAHKSRTVMLDHVAVAWLRDVVRAEYSRSPAGSAEERRANAMYRLLAFSDVDVHCRDFAACASWHAERAKYFDLIDAP